MDSITKTLEIGVTPEVAFEKFVNALNEWWPKEYTWSQERLENIWIDGRKNGLCTEKGPYGFRCEWGRVTELKEHQYISLKWQISAQREPIPDPDKASDIQIHFIKNAAATTLKFEHLHFENHGDDAQHYRDILNSADGWYYILDRFKTYC